MPIQCQVWDDITMDFIKCLPLSSGKTIIMVFVARLSKYARFIALSHPFTEQMVAQKFINGICQATRNARLSQVIGIQYLSAIFGRNFLKCLKHSSK